VRGRVKRSPNVTSATGEGRSGNISINTVVIFCQKMHMWPSSCVNKASNVKVKARGGKAKDLTLKAKATAKNVGLKAKAKD
jgi:hypothetical protein